MDIATQKILDKIIAVHGEKYAPSEIIVKEKRKIQLVCESHGVFEIRIDHLLNGAGCQACSKTEKAKRIAEAEALAFPIKAIKVHGDKYDYSKVNYQGHTTRVIIICKIHGEFSQAPRKHIEGSGCQQCGVEQQASKLNTEKFIARSIEVHGQNYDYSRTKFISSQKKVIIACPFHGEFEQLPHNHMKGVGCRKCANISLTKTTPQFINEANKVHNKIYNYDFVLYTGFRNPVEIECKLHGLFSMKPMTHLSGKGCQKCSIENRAARQAKGTLAFIKHANLVHDNRWDYSKSNYITTHIKVSIICPNHGVFEQTPSSHLSGKGCPTCGAESSIDNRKLKFSDFIERSNLAHNNNYTYFENSFTSSHIPTKILCNKHGEFTQRPSSHMRGIGCPECGLEKGDITRTHNSFMNAFELNELDNNDYDTDELKKLVFIKHANEVHNYFYDYSDIQISSRKDTIKILCPIHGHFHQKAERHIFGIKCPDCQILEKRIQTPEFVEKAKAIHGDRYEYSLAICNGYESVVKIICKQHGEFEQNARGHLRGNGCRQCYVDSTKSNTEAYISKCKNIHADKYHYEKTSYSTARESLIITCKEHGDFIQVANDHLNGAGCPKCAEYYRNLDNRNPESMCKLYFIKLKHNNTVFYKIGITTLSIEIRFKRLSTYDIEIIERHSIDAPLGKAIKAEQIILAEFKDYSFPATHILKDIGGGTECFAMNILAKYNMELEDYI